MSNLKDSFCRKINYVRLSLTDRCNFQCFYCRPLKAEKCFTPNTSYLNTTDIERLFLVFGKLGVTKVKLTGGEPLLRKDVCDIVKTLSENPYLRDISLTTNGYFLEKLAPKLKSSGLNRINISLDSLTPEKFERITATPTFHQVWKGILKALDVGFSPIKINIVSLRGINDNEVIDFVDLAMGTPLVIRFIEFMPTRRTSMAQKQFFISNQDILEKISKKFPLIPEISDFSAGPSRYYKIFGARGRIGFISPLSHNFCDRCNRIRITSRGEIRLCLFSQENFNILPLIRSENWEKELEYTIEEQLKIKPRSHDLKNNIVGNIESFATVGG